MLVTLIILYLTIGWAANIIFEGEKDVLGYILWVFFWPFFVLLHFLVRD